jgi:hypothetical protein
MNIYLSITFGVVSTILFVGLYNNWLYTWIESIIAPLFVVSAVLTIIYLYLTIFNTTIQQAWWRWARFALLIPFATIILLLPTYQNGGGFITFGGTSDLVILWGVVFAIATLIYTLYQRFYVQRGIAHKSEVTVNQNN